MKRLLILAVISSIAISITITGCGEDDKVKKCATPTFSPNAGSFNSDQTITLSTTTQNATIYYTTDNSNPSTNSSEYSAPIPVTGHGTSLTIKAIAVKTGMNNSDIASGTFTVNYLHVAAPQISPESDKYYSEQAITITCATDGATIHYTTDNTDPSETEGTILASGDSFKLGSSSTIRAIAYKTGMLTSTISSVDYTFQQWTWVSGDNTTGQSGVYGTKGTGSTDNKPGARERSISWIDSSGNLWLFGGLGWDAYVGWGRLNDLWNFEPSTGKWTWVSADNTVDQPGVYGTKGTGSTDNKPGAREYSISWIDSSENLWLFGGLGNDASGDWGELNDLWKFVPSTGEWTWVSGDNILDQPGVYGTKGTGSADNKPGARKNNVSWIDSAGNLWLFGGLIFDVLNDNIGLLNDLWKFEPSTGEWTWVSGDNTTRQPGVYGTKGTGSTDNIPGSRSGSVSWINSAGDLWLFGGEGYDISGTLGFLNDLWRFDPSTGEWTWVSGDNTVGQPGVYGTKGTGSTDNIPGARHHSVSWIDSSGNLWLFGGCKWIYFYNFELFNDLWKFEPSTTEWTWVSGSNTIDQLGVYGIKGKGDVSNIPGSRENSVSWIDSSGNPWLFGGCGYDAYGDGSSINDLWKFEP